MAEVKVPCGGRVRVNSVIKLGRPARCSNARFDEGYDRTFGKKRKRSNRELN